MPGRNRLKTHLAVQLNKKHRHLLSISTPSASFPLIGDLKKNLRTVLLSLSLTVNQVPTLLQEKVQFFMDGRVKLNLVRSKQTPLPKRCTLVMLCLLCNKRTLGQVVLNFNIIYYFQQNYRLTLFLTEFKAKKARNKENI